jgi:hypothetical protein
LAALFDDDDDNYNNGDDGNVLLNKNTKGSMSQNLSLYIYDIFMS